MTNDKEKEQIRSKFHKVYIDFCEDGSSKNLYDVVVNFCYSEIEERERDHELTKIELSNKKILLESCESALAEREAKLKSQSEIIQAADEVMKSLDIDHRPNWVHNTDETYEAIEKYNTLKVVVPLK